MTLFFRFWLITLAIKAALAVWLPFSSDEAYYWVWGHFPQLSYYDHPPMVGWLFWLGRELSFGGQSARLPAVILGHLTLLVWNRILTPYLDEKSRRWWMGFVLLSPFLGIGSLIVTPDLPLVFFWSLGIWALLEAVNKKTALAYSLLGAVLGLGFCAKYHMVLFVPIAWVWLLISGRWREVALRFVPLTIFAGLLFCAPVWYWNMTNDWVSFRFQFEHGFKGGPWNPSWPLEYVAGQIALIFPLMLWQALRRKEPKELSWLHAFAWLPLLFFFYTSFKARVEANWPIIAYPAILALGFLNDSSRRWVRATMCVWAIAILLIFTQLIFPWIPIDERKLKTSEMTKFDALVAVADEYQPLFASSYQMASTLSYKRKDIVFKLVGMNRRDFFDFHPMSRPRTEVFYVAVEGGYPFPDWLTQSGAEVREVRHVSNELRIFEVRQVAQNNGN